MSEMTAFEFENALNNAMLMHLKMQSQKDIVEGIASPLLGALIPKKKDRNLELLTQLEIAKSKKALGLPTDSDDLEQLLNEDKTLLDPGRAIALGSVALGSKAPLFRSGANPFFSGAKNGSISRSVGAIAKFFR